MSHLIPESFIQDVLMRIDLVDLIDSCVPLKRAGANFTACCPFHEEKTPSFTVSPSKQFYHCFGCGAHGTAIGFLMEYQGLGFIDAIHRLAARAGLQMPELRNDAGQASKPETGNLLRALSSACDYYRSQLGQSDKAIAYLKQRGLSGEIAAHFGLGYAPEDWQNLATIFSSYHQDKTLLTAGLVICNEQGRRYDRFRNRIMFPIMNLRNEVIGFGGRILDQGEPKYLNSPESPLFEKGRELFGLPQARNALRHENTAIVVEGYMDVIALAQHGVENVVATLGTATTTEQLQKLLRQVNHIVFCFDGDTAGRQAAWRALCNALPILPDHKRIGFIFLPDNDDPDSLIRREGKKAFQERVRHALPLSNYLIGELSKEYPPGSAEGRAALIAAAKPLLQKLQAPVLRLQLIKRLTEITRLTQQEIERTCQLRAFTAAPPAKSARCRAPSLLQRLLLFVLDEPGRIARVPVRDMPDNTEESRLLQHIRDLVEQQPTMTSGELIRVLGNEPLLLELSEELLSNTLNQEDFDHEDTPDEAEFTGILNKLAEQARLRAFAALQEKVKARGVSELNSREKQEYLDLLSAVGNRQNVENISS